MAREADPEVKAAIQRGAIAEAVLLAVGVVLFVATDQVVWVIGMAAAGAAVLVLLMAQAGAFKGRDERR
jgi:multisubunit Na+/H+ antiporter MnhC subunit